MTCLPRALGLVERAVAEGAAPCAAVAVGVKGRVLARAVYGSARVVGGVVPAGEGTRFDMASLTKLLSPTMVALRMLEEGRLTLRDTLGDWFGEEVPPARRDITVFQLMTHTGGFLPHLSLEEACPAGPEGALAAILASAPACPPGAQVHYSCLGFIVLGKLLERAGGAPLDELARRYVFEPLGMAHTGYRPTGGSFAATEPAGDGRCLSGVVHDENARFLGGVSGNAGVFSDLDDMVRFASMLACGGLHQGRPYLSPAVLRAAGRNYTPGMAEHRGLGFHLPGPGSFHGDLFPPESLGHTGFTGTSLIVDPTSGLYVVLLTNRVHPTRENTKFLRVRRTVHNAAMAEFSAMEPKEKDVIL